jgi:curved DNA-binding protein CbpA
MPEPRDYYELLGVDPRASEAAIRRAHRKRAVVKHRRGVMQLEDELRHMQNALAVLTDPEQRRRYDEHRLLSQAAFVELPPEEDAERVRREGRRLHEFRREIGRDASRLSREATSAHSDAMRRVGEEHDAHELAQARALRRRALVARTVRVGLWLVVIGGVWFVWSRYG